MSAHQYHHPNITRMTIDFPAHKHKELKAVSALLGVPMKEFVLSCVLEKLDRTLVGSEEQEKKDAKAFDDGLASIRKHGGISLEEMKKRLGFS